MTQDITEVDAEGDRLVDIRTGVVRVITDLLELPLLTALLMAPQVCRQEVSMGGLFFFNLLSRQVFLVGVQSIILVMFFQLPEIIHMYSGFTQFLVFKLQPRLCKNLVLFSQILCYTAPRYHTIFCIHIMFLL